MDPSVSDLPPIFEIYTRYRDIVDSGKSKEALVMLSKSLDSIRYTSGALFNDLYKLMTHLDLFVDSHQFSCFYNFVFFTCRENGQKNISVDRAISAWRLVLSGRFRLLNQWCDFVEKNQRHNVSEDTWQQLLAFSRCVNEDLEGYDPKGAWPVLIDDFVEHMYRVGHPGSCSSGDFDCNCMDMGIQRSISNTLRGLKLLPGSKRKSSTNDEEKEERSYFCKSPAPSYPSITKRNMETSVTNSGDYHINMDKANPFGCSNTSSCAVEDSLSKGFKRNLSPGTGCSFHHGKKSKVQYT